MIIKHCCSFALKFLQQCLLVWFRSVTDMPQTSHLKDVNNHHTFSGTDSHFQLILRKQCHNNIQITHFKLLKYPGLSV